MKRNIIRTGLALLTALILATAISACGGGGGSSTPSSGNGATLSGSAQ